MEKTFELINFQANSFQGIDKSRPVFVDFTKMRKNQGFTELAGKTGKGKTSTLNGIAYSIGARFSLDKKRLINTVDGEIDESTTFRWDGEKYKIEVSADRIAIKRNIEGEDKWTLKGIDKPPMEFIKDVFGKVMFIPFFVKDMKGKDVIEYFQQTFGSGDDGSKKMKAVEAEIDKIFTERRDINRDAKQLSAALELEPLFQNYEKSQERFVKPISAEKEKKAFDEKAKNKADYDRYKTNLDLLKVGQEETQRQIKSLKQQLAAAEKEEKDTAERIVKGDKWMEENKNVPKEFEAANKEWLNLSQTIADYEKWKGILSKEKQYNDKQEQAITKTGELDEARERLLKLTKSCLPKVAGLTVKVAAGIDKTGQPEGVFYVVPGKKQEQAIHELSESEYADMWCNILEAEDAQFVFIENITSFGDNVVNTLNQFVKNGGHVFYTIMDRKLNELGITFKSKIE